MDEWHSTMWTYFFNDDLPGWRAYALSMPPLGSVDNYRNCNDESMLYAACRQNRTEWVAAILDAGSRKINVASKEKTPLTIAVMNCNLEMVRLLIERGADPLLEDTAYSSFYCVFMYNRDKIARYLLRAVPAILTAEFEYHRNILHIALRCAESVMADILHRMDRQGILQMLEKEDGFGYTPLDMAICVYNDEVGRHLCYENAITMLRFGAVPHAIPSRFRQVSHHKRLLIVACSDADTDFCTPNQRLKIRGMVYFSQSLLSRLLPWCSEE